MWWLIENVDFGYGDPLHFTQGGFWFEGLVNHFVSNTLVKATVVST